MITQFIKLTIAASDYAPWCIDSGDGSHCGRITAKEERETTNEQPKRVCYKCRCLSLGYEVETVQSGQVRRYGDTINIYHVTDTVGGREKAEVLEFCRTHVKQATMRGEEGYHPLQSHVMHFSQRSDGVWLYKAGHEYTG